MRNDARKRVKKRERKKRKERERCILAYPRAFVLGEQALGKMLSVNWTLP